MIITGLLKAISSNDLPLYKSIKNLFGFYPGNLHLYKLAMCHKAAPPKIIKGQYMNNERLEYLGDAVLGSIVADYLYKKFPYKPEGYLTEMRSRIVSRSRLNKLARKLGFQKMIFNSERVKTKSKSIYGDTFEAVIGAIYLDKGYEFTKKVVIKRIIDIHLDIDKVINTETNFKSRVLEWAQKEKRFLEFKVINEIGEGYNKQYVVDLLIEKESYGIAQDFSIKGAEQLASEKALEKLQLDDELDEENGA